MADKNVYVVFLFGNSNILSSSNLPERRGSLRACRREKSFKEESTSYEIQGCTRTKE